MQSVECSDFGLLQLGRCLLQGLGIQMFLVLSIVKPLRRNGSSQSRVRVGG